MTHDGRSVPRGPALDDRVVGGRRPHGERDHLERSTIPHEESSRTGIPREDELLRRRPWVANRGGTRVHTDDASSPARYEVKPSSQTVSSCARGAALHESPPRTGGELRAALRQEKADRPPERIASGHRVSAHPYRSLAPILPRWTLTRHRPRLRPRVPRSIRHRSLLSAVSAASASTSRSASRLSRSQRPRSRSGDCSRSSSQSGSLIRASSP